ncbi:hypothetical protein [Magnetospirillum sp. SS-4]|uniref:hypothetical protein n=1 Tax=Magnetospirillum sp. SS-4 TaxID=2681465 RepID=UPI001573B896|nr:hypothetical protein [Magnetospirillum sp. SS-4]
MQVSSNDLNEQVDNQKTEAGGHRRFAVIILGQAMTVPAPANDNAEVANKNS